MRASFTLAAALLCAFAAPAAAQVTVTPGTLAEPIPAGGSAELPVEVRVSCTTLLTGGGSADVTFTLDGAPEWLTGAGEAAFTGTACASPSALDGVSQSANLTLTAAAEAPGLMPAAFTLVATAQGSVGEPTTGEGEVGGVFVAYAPGHTVSHGTRSFDVTGGTLPINLTIEVQANAKTMVMFEDKVVQPAGARVDGLNAVTFDVANGQRNTTLPLVFHAPEGSWENVTVMFRNFSHCIAEQVTADCTPALEQNVTWTFRNRGGSGDGDGDGKDSPGAAPLAVLAGLAAVAALRRRR